MSKFNCEKGGYCIFGKAQMHKGDKKCDKLLSYLEKLLSKEKE